MLKKYLMPLAFVLVLLGIGIMVYVIGDAPVQAPESASVAMQQEVGVLNVKEVPEQKILVVEYTGEGHIAPYFGYLVAYYNREETPFEVVFPQMSIEMSQTEQWIAIAYEGEAEESEEVKTSVLPAVTVAAMIHKGGYQTLPETVQKAYQELRETAYIPDSGHPLRLLYWNSPDDTHAKELITEIQIPIRKIGTQ